MARKTADGEKFSKKTKRINNKDLNSYSQKAIRIREETLFKRKEVYKVNQDTNTKKIDIRADHEKYINTRKNESNSHSQRTQVSM